MSYRIRQPQFLKTTILVTGIALLLNGCADKSAIREKERARYENLENELLDAQAAEERQRRADMRVAEKLRQLDTQRLQSKRERPQYAPPLPNPDFSSPAVLPDSPVVTQIVVASADVDEADGIWKFRDFPSPIDGLPLCAVVSDPVVVQNGTLDTRVQVIISNEAIFLRTDATFDTQTPETGFRLDAGIPISFDRFHNELTAVVDAGYPRLFSALGTSSTLRASFAYSPQLSSSETHVVELTLNSINTVLPQLASCGAASDDVINDSSPAES